MHPVGPPNIIPLAHLHAAFHEELLCYAAAPCAALQCAEDDDDNGVAAAAMALDAASALAAAAQQRALGGDGHQCRAVVSGSVYGSLHRRLVTQQHGAPDSNDVALQPPPSPRQALMRFYA